MVHIRFKQVMLSDVSRVIKCYVKKLKFRSIVLLLQRLLLKSTQTRFERNEILEQKHESYSHKLQSNNLSIP